jgi:hypothetical protein
MLPSVTLMAHAVTFVALEAVFAESWGSSWVATYDLVAVAASVIGLWGATQVRRVLQIVAMLCTADYQVRQHC